MTNNDVYVSKAFTLCIVTLTVKEEIFEKVQGQTILMRMNFQLKITL